MPSLVNYKSVIVKHRPHVNPEVEARTFRLWQSSVGMRTTLTALMTALALLETIEPTVYVVRCSCGTFYSESDWNKLPLVGWQWNLELRNCHCRSTISREILPEPIPDTLKVLDGPW